MSLTAPSFAQMLFRKLARFVGRRSWIRFGIRDRFARLVENPDSTVGHAFRQSFHGGVYIGNTGNFIDWNARYFGAYSGEELRLFAESVAPLAISSVTPSVLEVGANVGNHSLFYGLFGAKVLAFEPNPQAAALLRDKLVANHLDRVTVFPMGLSDHEAVLDLSLPDNSNLGAASLEFVRGESSVPVRVVCGDEVPEIKDLKRLDFVKVDVEGHECQVLAGLVHTLIAHRPLVFFEWNAQFPFQAAISRFPESYSFWRFVADRRFGIFFGNPGYSLHRVVDGEEPGAANLLAVPASLLPSALRRRESR